MDCWKGWALLSYWFLFVMVYFSTCQAKTETRSCNHECTFPPAVLLGQLCVWLWRCALHRGYLPHHCEALCPCRTSVGTSVGISVGERPAAVSSSLAATTVKEWREWQGTSSRLEMSGHMELEIQRVESSDLGAWKSSMCSYVPSHLSSPSCYFQES